MSTSKSTRMDVNNDESIWNEHLGINGKYVLKGDEYFMAIALLVGKRSEDPSSQVGACIVNEDQNIVGVGYNGMPNGCENKFSWEKYADNPLERKYMYVCHAAMNAVVNKNVINLKNCKIYNVIFPCNECAKILIQSGIKEVVFLSDKRCYKNETIASKKLFEAAGVITREFKYDPENSKIVIDFCEIDWDNKKKRPSVQNECESTSKKMAKNDNA
ncbi:unnamed protein product [Phyllotreta striolata]|uniref:Probable deoxycytidylate deaminase n=1 Tax=Phyllotreta striolata TaxID=444603 RepID=A0A9N9TJM2_PHYSR|nr:unnamed protein product [Phyllotreta striolata]